MKLPRIRLALGLLALALASVTGLHAAPTPAPAADTVQVADLGLGLTYVRPAADTPAQFGLVAGPVVLDLRYFTPAANADNWIAAIQAFATPKRPCFVLLSPETSPALLAALADGIPNCITLGYTAPHLKTDITVNTTAANDRAAWTAGAKLDASGLEKLITPVIDKPRYDEAALAKEHADDLAGTSAPDAPDAPAASAPTAQATPAPLIDAVLLRAVQIDRGLLALKKL